MKSRRYRRRYRYVWHALKDDTHQKDTIFIHLPALLLRNISQARRESSCQETQQTERVIPMISDELREGECYVVNDAYMEVVNKTYLQHTTICSSDLLVLLNYCAQAESKIIYFRSGKPGVTAFLKCITSIL